MSRSVRSNSAFYTHLLADLTDFPLAIWSPSFRRIVHRQKCKSSMPKEYPTVQLIQSLWAQGRAVGEIVRYLNEKGYRSRLNRDWGYGVVKGVIKGSGSK